MREIAIGVLFFAWGVVFALTAMNGPECPQEDSCYADYHNGAWHIYEGERPW